MVVGDCRTEYFVRKNLEALCVGWSKINHLFVILEWRATHVSVTGICTDIEWFEN